MKKSILRISVFLIILILVLSGVNHILEFKHSDGIAQMTQFYQQDRNTVDVLILGSSHSFVNFNNATLWEDGGISSYNLGGSSQPLWITYHMLLEALKTQSPELIILEGYGTVFDFEYDSEVKVIKNLHSMKWSPNKVSALLASTSLGKLGGVIMDYRQYHTRYSVLEKADFTKDYENQSPDFNWFDDDWKGQYLFNTSNPMEFMDVAEVDTPIDLQPKSEDYYRKILALAQEKNIPIVVVTAPYQINEFEQGRLLRAAQIAAEYGVTFLDGNYLLPEIGLDLETDYHDDCHMTAKGSVKFTRYIEKELLSQFGLCDHKGDPHYSSWERHTAFVNSFLEQAVE